jgi:hypothetical protein
LLAEKKWLEAAKHIYADNSVLAVGGGEPMRTHEGNKTLHEKYLLFSVHLSSLTIKHSAKNTRVLPRHFERFIHEPNLQQSIY